MAKKLCPLLKKPCIEHECEFFFPILGTLPQTGEVVNKFDCVVKWLPHLLMENTQQARQAGAAFEGVRNEMHAGAAGMVMNALARAEGKQLLEAKREDFDKQG